jgi:hypothetical protein
MFSVLQLLPMFFLLQSKHLNNTPEIKPYLVEDRQAYKVGYKFKEKRREYF